MRYREEVKCTETTRQDYVNELDKLLIQRKKDLRLVREENIKGVFENSDEYRENFRRMLGWPLVDYKAEDLPSVTMEEVTEEDGYVVYRATFEILDGLNMTGLLFKASDDKPKPMVIVQHGGAGTPELVAGFYGDTENYHDVLERLMREDVHIFAPQLLLWREEYGVNHNRYSLDLQLKRVSSSITAIEVFGITRILDYFEKQEYVSVFGMAGLSYGGFYTLFTAAADTRIKSALSSCFFNDRDEQGWSDWTWYRSAEFFDDAEIACLVYPRNICIQVGKNDEMFDYKYAEASFDRVKRFCSEVGTDWVNFVVFDGVHEFYFDDGCLEKLVNDLK